MPDERFGQLLSSPLIPSASYRLTGRLRQAVRADLNNPGGYQVLLALAGQTTGIELVTIGPTTAGGGWEAFGVTFSAPADAVSRPLLIVEPVGIPVGNSAYAGLDDLSPTADGTAAPALGGGLPSTQLAALVAIGVLWISRLSAHTRKHAA